MTNAHHAPQSGDQETAKRLLVAALRADPRNVQSWLWMSEAVDTEEQKRDCLLRVLAIEPDNQAARAGLARLAAQASSPAGDHSLDAGQESYPATMDNQSNTIEHDWGRPMLGIAATRRTANPQICEADRTAQVQLAPQIKLAGALTLTLLVGLALLAIALIRIIPQEANRLVPPSPDVLHTATLWCPSCEREGRPVAFSTRIGASFYRGARASGLPHGTRVSVLRYRWSTLERRYYALVAAEGKRGWVPETQIRK